MLRLKATILACRIEYHWWFVTRYRRAMHKLYEKGFALSSPKILQLSRRLSKHAVFIMKAEKYYEERYFPIVGGVL